MCARLCPSRIRPCPFFIGSYTLKFFIVKMSLSMFSWRRYLRDSLSPSAFGLKDNNGVPHHGTKRFNCILVPKHITNSRRETVIVIIVHGIFVASNVKSLQLAECFVVAKTLHVTEASPEASSRKNSLQQARCCN